MPATNPRAAVEEFLAPLRRIAACVTDRPLLASGFRPSRYPYRLTFAPIHDPVPLRTASGTRGVFLELDQEYVVESDHTAPHSFVARTSAYRYRFLDREDREILAYHWHPTGRSPVTYPHLHLAPRVRPLDIGPDVEPVALAEMHLPTGPVGFADIVRLAIAEFGARPRRPDWAAILG